MASGAQLCTFKLGRLFLGVPVQDVQEVIRYQEMTRIALAPPAVRGLINLRGQIVTAIDMRTRLSLPPRASGELPMNVVLTPDHGSVSLLVDDIGDVLDLDDRKLEAIPSTVDPAYHDLIRGVYKLDGQLLLLLDPNRAIELNRSDAA